MVILKSCEALPYLYHIMQPSSSCFLRHPPFIPLSFMQASGLPSFQVKKSLLFWNYSSQSPFIYFFAPNAVWVKDNMAMLLSFLCDPISRSTGTPRLKLTFQHCNFSETKDNKCAFSTGSSRPLTPVWVAMYTLRSTAIWQPCCDGKPPIYNLHLSW